jgi:hypothetical protein
VHLVAAAVVRLVRTLAHGYFSEGFRGMSTPQRGQCGLRPAPPTHAAAWWRIVDMRHPSTRSDRPTVRGGETRGQTSDDASRACLWMTACPQPRKIVTFHFSAVLENRSPTRSSSTM